MTNETNWLVHHGVKGQKWGVRREKVKTPRKRKIKQTPEQSKKSD